MKHCIDLTHQVTLPTHTQQNLNERCFSSEGEEQAGKKKRGRRTKAENTGDGFKKEYVMLFCGS